MPRATKKTGSTAAIWRLAVPASSANLGPGFDALALALDFGLRIEARLGAPRDRLVWSGEGAGELALDRRNLLLRGLAAGRAHWGEGESLAIHASSAIPIGRGLGSSAAAVVAGLALSALSAGRRPQPQELLELGSRIEGHADNIAAALLGGLALVARDGATWRAVRLPIDRRLGLLLAIPNRRLDTAAARALLPKRVPLGAAVSNLQRFGLLLTALARGRAGTLRPALEDELHQPFRMAQVPELKELLELRCERLLGVCLSGAGPTVLAFVRAPAPKVESQMRKVLARHGGGRVRRCRAAARGLRFRRTA